jgi:hypothetical protein
MAPRRTISEWITVARVARTVGHLFVEGATDARILIHLSGYPTSVDIRTAQEVDCETEESNSFFGGFKLRLMKLALDSSSTPNLRNLLCFVDADFGCLVESVNRAFNLVRTDYANLPSEAMTQDWLKAHLLKCYGHVLSNDDWTTIIEALRDSFIARYLSAQSNRPRPIPLLSNHCDVAKGCVNFDRYGYMSEFSGRRNLEVQKILIEVDLIKSLLPHDVRHACNSKDLFDIIYGVLRKSKKISGAYPRDAVMSAFFGAFPNSIIPGTRLEFVIKWVKSFA